MSVNPTHVYCFYSSVNLKLSVWLGILDINSRNTECKNSKDVTEELSEAEKTTSQMIQCETPSDMKQACWKNSYTASIRES